MGDNEKIEAEAEKALQQVAKEFEATAAKDKRALQQAQKLLKQVEQAAKKS